MSEGKGVRKGNNTEGQIKKKNSLHNRELRVLLIGSTNETHLQLDRAWGSGGGGGAVPELCELPFGQNH